MATRFAPHFPARWAPALLAGLLTACAPATRVVLLPQSGGAPSAVTVTHRQMGHSTGLDQPYQAAEVSHSGAVVQRQWNAEKVEATYGGMLALKPADALHFTLFFQPGSSSLTAESESMLAQIIAAAQARKGGEIVVTGHTDRVGTVETNDALSLQRARSIRELLTGQGFKPELVQAVGRGEREPAIATEDEVDEPRNRRAEVLVR